MTHMESQAADRKTFRDVAALAALTGLLSKSLDPNSSKNDTNWATTQRLWCGDAAKWAYEYADAMLKERDRT